MARDRFQTLTEQMFYVLLILKEECCGMDIMGRVKTLTEGRVVIGPGTLYNLLDQFTTSGLIRETAAEGRRRNYILTEDGENLLEREVERLKKQIMDFENLHF